MKRLPNGLLAWGLLILLALMWGSSFILIKKGLKALAADEVGALRIISASAFLLPVAVFYLKGLNRRHVATLFIIGFAGSFIPAFLFAKAQTEIASSMAGILNSLTPLFTILIGAAFFVQKITRSSLFGLILGLIGCLFLMISGSKGELDQINFYALYVILASVLYGFNLNIIKYKLPDLSSITITSVSLLFVGPAALGYLYFSTSFFSSFSTAGETYLWSLGAIVLLGVVGTALALIVFNHLVKLTQPVFASSVTYLIPIVAVVWGIIDGESIYLADYIGLFAVISGVYLANRGKKIQLKKDHIS